MVAKSIEKDVRNHLAAASERSRVQSDSFARGLDEISRFQLVCEKLQQENLELHTQNAQLKKDMEVIHARLDLQQGQITSQEKMLFDTREIV